MPWYRYDGNVLSNDKTATIKMADTNSVIREVSIGQTIELSSGQLDAIDDRHIFTSVGGPGNTTAVIMPSYVRYYADTEDMKSDNGAVIPIVTTTNLDASVAASAVFAQKPDIKHDLGGTTTKPLVRPSNRMLMSSPLAIGQTPAVQAGITFPARTTGVVIGSPMDTAAAALLNTMGGTSLTTGQITRRNPNFADAKNDTTFKIVGPFTYLGGPTGTTQQVGQFQIGRSDSTPDGGGFTGSYGTISYKFTGRYLVRIMRDNTATQYLQMTLAKDGGPFKVHRDLADSQFGQEIFTTPGDNVYYLQAIDLGANATWQIREEMDNATFGGYYFPSTSTMSAPDWRVPIGFVSGDSFSVPGQGQFRATLGFVSQLSRMLGCEIHLSGCGGTGFRAKGGSFDGNGNPVQGNLLNYVERLPYDLDRYFDDNRQPDFCLGLGSQNDRSFGFTGGSQLDTNIATWISTMRERFPDKPVVVTGLMHSRVETWNADYNTINAQLLAAAEANPRWGVRYVRSLLQDGIATGTGYQGNTNGTGTSDYLTWTDSSHLSPGPSGGSGAVAVQIRDYLTQFFPIIKRSNKGIPASGSLPTFDASQVSSGVFSIGRLPSDEVSKARMIKNWRVKIDGTNHPGAVFRVPGVGGTLPILGQPGSAEAAWYLDPNDPLWAVAGKITRFYGRVWIQVGDTAPGTGFGVVLLEVAAPTGGGSGAGLSVASVGTISGSTMADYTSAQLTANTRKGPADSNTIPGEFSLSSAKWVVPRIQTFSVAFAANASLTMDIELFVKNI